MVDEERVEHGAPSVPGAARVKAGRGGQATKEVMAAQMAAVVLVAGMEGQGAPQTQVT